MQTVYHTFSDKTTLVPFLFAAFFRQNSTPPPPYNREGKGCEMMVIYVDVLLALNWWIDYLLLLAVRRTAGDGAKAWRLAVGALVGALSCLTLLLPPLPLWLTLVIRLLSAAVMVTVAFRRRSWRDWWRRVLYLFAYSVGFAGLCGALYFFVAPQGFYVANGVVYYSVPPLLLVALTVVCYGILWLWEQWSRRRAPKEHLLQVRLTYEGRQVTFPCLYDSGNHLVEPFSGYPVLIVERATAENILSVPATIEHLTPGDGWRLIPYDTLGGDGLLPAFIPSSAVAVTGSGEIPLPPCYVAVCERLSSGEYNGLLGIELGDYIR